MCPAAVAPAVQGYIKEIGMMEMTEQDRDEFVAYLEACTNRQLDGVLAKERAAYRDEYVELVLDEIEQRT